MSRLFVFHLLTHLIDNIYFQLYKCVVCTMKRERNWSVGNYVEISSASGEGLELEVTCSFFIVRFFTRMRELRCLFTIVLTHFLCKVLPPFCYLTEKRSLTLQVGITALFYQIG